MRGLYPGRFQPFHYGHLSVVKWALERVDELIIVIGSAQESHTLTNPFTAGERIEMIKNALLEYGIPSHRFYIIPVPDISINSIWAYYIKSFVPSFQKVLGRNSLVIRLFREAGIETENPPEFDRINYNSTYIRKLIIKSDNRWRSLVPKSVSKFIEEINGEERLREIVGIKVKKL